MIVTFLLIVAFIRSTPWRRERRAIIISANSNNSTTTHTTNIQPTNTNNIEEEQHKVPNTIIEAEQTLSLLEVSPISSQRRRSLKTHEVTFSGSVVGGSTDSDIVDNSKPDNPPNTKEQSSRPTTPDSNSSTSLLYRSLSSGRTQTANLTDDYESALTETSRRLLHKKRIFSRFNTQATEDDFNMETQELDEDADEPDEDSYDRDTDEFYSNIQDATGTTSGTRSKRSSLFSRSDSSATTTSSSGTFTGKRRSTASILSTSVCSDVIPLDRRRSSTTTEYSVRSGIQVTQRRSSGRSRRNISRMTIAGARRRTTGRY